MHPEYDRSLYEASTGLLSLDGLRITNKLIGADVELAHCTQLAL
jgi:hypothetical protein